MKNRILIAEHDLENLYRIEKVLNSALWKEDSGLTLQDIDLIETIERVRHNLKNGANYYKRVPKSEKHWYDAECDRCGWFGSSEYLLGGAPIADTGDYGDVYCPICGNSHI